MIVSTLGLTLFFTIGAALHAQEASLDEIPGLRERAVVMHIVSQVVEQNQQVVWNTENTRITIPGRPVGLKIVGENLVIEAQFTPLLRRSGRHSLVAQSQIWVSSPNQGVSYYTTIQTIPLEFNEQVYFFPLGSITSNDQARIEIQLMLEPLSGEAATTNMRRGRGNPSP